MPKYRFTTDDGDKLETSKDRLVMPNDEAASREAQRVLANMARDKLPYGSQFDLRVVVENEADEVVYQASMQFRGETAEDMRIQARKAARAAMNGRHSPHREN